MAKQELKVKVTADVEEIVRQLEEIVRSIKDEGVLCVRRGGDALVLRPQGPLQLEIEAEAKLDKGILKEKLTMEMKWKKTEANPAGDASSSMLPPDTAVL